MRTFAAEMKTVLLIPLFFTVPAEPEMPVELPSVTVTALKEQVETDRIASAVSAFSYETIKRNGTYREQSLSQMVPGLHIPEYGASLTSTIYLRGLGSRMENPVMGLYIDGIPVLDKNAYDFDWEGVRNVTMLRGPQGTLYGRNSMGGVLSLRTLSPSEDAAPEVSVEYGTAGTMRAGAQFVTGRNALSLTYRHKDGYFRNEYKDELCDPYDGLSMRWKWELHSGERLILGNILQASLSKEGGFAYGLWTDSVQYPVSYNDEGSYRRLSVIEGVKLDYYGDRIKTDAIASFQMLMDDMHMDQDYTSRSVFTLEQEQTSGAGTVELNIRRTDSDARWQPLTGLFAFYKGNRMKAPVIFKRDGIQTLMLDNANRNIPDEIGELAISESVMPVYSDFMIKSWNVALFHESVLDLDRWLLTAGLRFDYEGSVMDYVSKTELHYRMEPVMTDYKLVKVRYAGTEDHSHFEVLPKLSVLFRATDALSLYATLSKGYRAGGFNTQIFSDILQNKTMNATMNDMGVYMDSPYMSVSAGNTEYDPETAWNAELGMRMGADDWRVEASAYYTDVRNQQLTVFPPGKSTGRMMTNAGRSRSYGVEAQLMWNPDRLRTHVTWAWCDARFTDYNDGNNDYSGNRIPYVPEHTLHTGAGYSFPVGGRTLDVDCTLRGEGPFSWNEQGTQGEDFRLMLESRVALVMDGWEIYLRGENLTGTRGSSFYFKSMGNEFFAPVKPRTIMTGILFKL